jgi:hypothetical protein
VYPEAHGVLIGITFSLTAQVHDMLASKFKKILNAGSHCNKILATAWPDYDFIKLCPDLSVRARR